MAVLLIGVFTGLQFNRVEITVYRVSPKTLSQIKTDHYIESPASKALAGATFCANATQQVDGIGTGKGLMEVANQFH